MKLRHWMGGMIGAFAMAAICAPAEAAPLGSTADGMKAAASDSAAVQDVRWHRRCWRHRGHWHCRRVWSGDRYYYGGYPYAYDSPGIGLYFGGGRHHHHRRHHHRHHRH